jgi:hypothetical protein
VRIYNPLWSQVTKLRLCGGCRVGRSVASIGFSNNPGTRIWPTLGHGLDRSSGACRSHALRTNLHIHVEDCSIATYRRRSVYPRKAAVRLQQSFDRSQLIFREFFISEKDESIVLNVWNYFGAIGKRWPSAWSSAEMGLILNKTNGFLALMRYMRPVYLHLNGFGKVIPEEQFLSVFNRIGLRDGDFNRQRYLPGTSGETSLYKDLIERSDISERSDLM